MTRDTPKSITATQTDGGPEPPPDITSTEQLARDIHEGFRKPVAQRQIDVNTGVPFKEWDRLTEHAKEGRRAVARYLLDHWHITPRPSHPDGGPEPPPDSLPSDE